MMYKVILLSSLSSALLLAGCASNSPFMDKKKLTIGSTVVTQAGTPVTVYGQRGKCDATKAPDHANVLKNAIQIAPKNGSLSLGGEAYRGSRKCGGNVLVREIIYTPNAGFTGTENIKLSGDSVKIVVK